MTFEILHCGLSRWTSVWGDPLVTGLIIMALFLFAAGLCARAAHRSDEREKTFWTLAAVAALALAANVHLDLHVLPKSIGHCMAQAQGWYDQRETARAVFISGAVVAAAGMIATALWFFWRQMTSNIILTLGFVLTGVAQASKGFWRTGWGRLYDIPVGPF